MRFGMRIGPGPTQDRYGGFAPITYVGCYELFQIALAQTLRKELKPYHQRVPIRGPLGVSLMVRLQLFPQLSAIWNANRAGTHPR